MSTRPVWDVDLRSSVSQDGLISMPGIAAKSTVAWGHGDGVRLQIVMAGLKGRVCVWC